MRKICTYLFIAVALLLITSCKKDPPLWQIENLNNNEVTVLGHGGMGIYSLYPLDSYESVSECLAMGADGSEMDLQMSKDSVLFVFHSENLGESTACDGALFMKASTEINCTYTSLVHKNIKVISLPNMLAKLNRSEHTLFTFECKLNSNDAPSYLNAFANALIKQVLDHDLMENCFIESTSPEFLQLLRTKNSRLKLFLYTTNFENGLTTAKSLGLYGMTFDMFKITGDQIKTAHLNNLRIALFNQQKEKDNLDAIEMNADFIQTDKLEHVLKVLEKYKK